ncbi:hypothetical protein HN954_01580 [bacterium]|jgi:hypothetical protein|nr:hypothetical protein [bacterium]MBT6996100.1 hypothetical protein [bacterium]MBT7772733.1 hypothetical protein [bacterium]
MKTNKKPNECWYREFFPNDSLESSIFYLGFSSIQISVMQKLRKETLQSVILLIFGAIVIILAGIIFSFLGNFDPSMSAFVVIVAIVFAAIMIWFAHYLFLQEIKEIDGVTETDLMIYRKKLAGNE